jgi:hypothetical protein
MDTAEHIDGNGNYWGQGDNLIRLYIAQVPEDKPDSIPVFRMAEVIVNRENINDTVYLTPNDFILLY